MHRQIAFGGIDAPTELPESYRYLMGRHDAEINGYCLMDVLELLEDEYDVEWRTLFFNAGDEPDPDEPAHASASDAERVDHHMALVNPSWIGRDAADIPGEMQDPVWSIPTKQYTVVPNHEVWMPMADAFRKQNADVFGSLRLRRDGGEAHLDIFVDDYTVDPVDGESLTLGITTGHDYFGNTRLYVGAAAYHDTGDGVGQIIRRLTKRRKRRHVGDAGDEVVTWYEDSIERLDDISDTLYDVMADAMHHEVPMPDIPCSIVQFFEHLGLPNKAPNEIAEMAGKRAVQTATGPYTAYHLYKAGMWALEHHYESRDTKRFNQHVEKVNTILFNPALAERRVIAAVKEDIEQADDENADVYDYMRDDPDVTVETLTERMETISDGVDAFKDTREKVRAMLEDDGTTVAEGDA